MPPIDPALHAGSPVGDALLAILARRPDDALAVRYSTDIQRRTRTLRVGGARLELAFDRGHIRAEGRTLVVSELEIELLNGSPRVLLATARRWVAQHGLWLDGRSKAERGDLLARGERMALPTGFGVVDLARDMSGPQAWRCVLGACADQILGNASQIASGEYLPEHLHQLRVGLRRLRSAIELFDGEGTDAALDEPAAALFRRLGTARDAEVVEREFGPALREALRREDVAADGALLPGAGAPESLVALVREPATQGFLLDLLTALQAPPVAPVDAEPALRDHLAGRLAHWHRRVEKDTARFAELDDAAVHRLRKRAKRLRYAAEFAGSLFKGRAVDGYLDAMNKLQDRLGAITDVLTAARVFREATPMTVSRAFALGWLAARRTALTDAARRELRAFRKLPRFWKR
jgi:inorganic triphosphatase YgiF